MGVTDASHAFRVIKPIITNNNYDILITDYNLFIINNILFMYINFK